MILVPDQTELLAACVASAAEWGFVGCEGVDKVLCCSI